MCDIEIGVMDLNAKRQQRERHFKTAVVTPCSEGWGGGGRGGGRGDGWYGGRGGGGGVSENGELSSKSTDCFRLLSTTLSPVDASQKKLTKLLGSLQRMLLFVGCVTSQQQASVSQGWICSDNFTCCHTEIEVADQTFYLTRSQYTDTGPTSPSADPIMPGAWQGSH